MTSAYFIGIDVGGTKIFGGLVSPSGEVIASTKTSTPPKAGASAIIQLIEKLVRSLATDARVPFKNIRAVGVAVPGIVDSAGRVVITPNINLTGTDLQQVLARKLNKKVAVGNDVNLGVLGERWLGAGRKTRNIVGIFPGTGVGGGIIINNEFVTGSQGAAAEIGHMQVDPLGPACTCGNNGCLEAYAGRWAMERDIRMALKKGQRSLISQLAGENFTQIKSGMLAKALKEKDRLVTDVITRAAERLGRACVSLNHLFNPDMFILGGGVVEACGEAILPLIEKALKDDPFFKNLKAPKIVRARLGDDAVMLGAVAMAKKACGEKLDGKCALYPLLKRSGTRAVMVKGKALAEIFYVRADGKLKWPKEVMGVRLSDMNLEDICKKGPDSLIIAYGRRRPTLTPKALKFLKKKQITPRILPLAEAIQAFNGLDDRRAFLFLP